MSGARPSDQALVPTASSPQAVSTKGFDPSRCRNCAGEQWVCENHQDTPWESSGHAETCGAGAPCPVCNREMACASFIPWWQPMGAAPTDGTQILISGGTVSYDAETFPTDRPFEGVALARFEGGEWCGGYGSEYDGQYWHKPERWMPTPKLPASGMEAATAGETTKIGSTEGDSPAREARTPE